jgi:hypothetical protein
VSIKFVGSGLIVYCWPPCPTSRQLLLSTSLPTSRRLGSNVQFRQLATALTTKRPITLSIQSPTSLPAVSQRPSLSPRPCQSLSFQHTVQPTTSLCGTLPEILHQAVRKFCVLCHESACGRVGCDTLRSFHSTCHTQNSVRLHGKCLYVCDSELSSFLRAEPSRTCAKLGSARQNRAELV